MLQLLSPPDRITKNGDTTSVEMVARTEVTEKEHETKMYDDEC